MRFLLVRIKKDAGEQPGQGDVSPAGLRRCEAAFERVVTPRCGDAGIADEFRVRRHLSDSVRLLGALWVRV